jgi:hypothetical protein
MPAAMVSAQPLVPSCSAPIPFLPWVTRHLPCVLMMSWDHELAAEPLAGAWPFPASLAWGFVSFRQCGDCEPWQVIDLCISGAEASQH